MGPFLAGEKEKRPFYYFAIVTYGKKRKKKPRSSRRKKGRPFFLLGFKGKKKRGKRPYLEGETVYSGENKGAKRKEGCEL